MGALGIRTFQLRKRRKRAKVRQEKMMMTTATATTTTPTMLPSRPLKANTRRTTTLAVVDVVDHEVRVDLAVTANNGNGVGNNRLTETLRVDRLGSRLSHALANARAVDRARVERIVRSSRGNAHAVGTRKRGSTATTSLTTEAVETSTRSACTTTQKRTRRCRSHSDVLGAPRTRPSTQGAALASTTLAATTIAWLLSHKTCTEQSKTSRCRKRTVLSLCKPYTPCNNNNSDRPRPRPRPRRSPPPPPHHHASRSCAGQICVPARPRLPRTEHTLGAWLLRSNASAARDAARDAVHHLLPRSQHNCRHHAASLSSATSVSTRGLVRDPLPQPAHAWWW